MKPRCHSESGLTLVELMLALLLAILLMGGVFMAYNVNHKTSHVQSQITMMQQDLRAVMDIVEREVRMAGYDPGRSTTAGIISADPGQISISMDINADGVLSGDQEIVNFRLDEDGNILRNSEVLAGEVTLLTFQYYREDGSPATAPVGSSDDSDVKNIRVSMTFRSVQEDPETEEYYTRANVRDIRCRNMGL